MEVSEMRKDSSEFLERLLDAPSPSGFEQAARAMYREYVSAFADEVRTDVMGNTIAALNPTGSPRVILAGHIDEIGLIVTHVDEKGFLHIAPIGGWDSEVLVGQRVRVLTDKGPIAGVIAKPPIHLQKPKEREKKADLRRMVIDIGAADGKAARKMVAVGDAVVLDAAPLKLAGRRMCARGADDRLGAFVVAEALRRLSGAKRLKAAVFSVATVQEEVGLRGARTSAWGVDPQVGVAVDVTFASDQVGVEASRVGDVKLGKGPVLTRGANINPVLHKKMLAAAGRLKMGTQLQAIPGGTGTDANVIQLTRAGVATGLVSIPLRYMHSPVEVFDLRDLDACAGLLAAFCESLRPDDDFTP